MTAPPLTADEAATAATFDTAQYPAEVAEAKVRAEVADEIRAGLLAHRDPGVKTGDGDLFGKAWNSALTFAAEWTRRNYLAIAAMDDRNQQ